MSDMVFAPRAKLRKKLKHTLRDGIEWRRFLEDYFPEEASRLVELRNPDERINELFMLSDEEAIEARLAAFLEDNASPIQPPPIGTNRTGQTRSTDDGPPKHRLVWWLMGGGLVLALSVGGVVWILSKPPNNRLTDGGVKPSVVALPDLIRSPDGPSRLPDLAAPAMPPKQPLSPSSPKPRPSQPAIQWDLARDFTKANPSGVWTFGWSPPDGWHFNKFTGFEEKPYPVATPPNHSMPGHRIGTRWVPTVWKNTSEAEVYGVPKGKISLHPGGGEQGENKLREICVVRWTNPRDSCTGIVEVDAKFYPGNVTKNELEVRINDAVVPGWILGKEPGKGGMVDHGAFGWKGSAKTTRTVDFAVGGEINSGRVGGSDTPLDVTVRCTGG